jgi:starch synthase
VYYKDDPIFTNSKVVVSVYGNEISGSLNPKMVSKIKFDEIESDTFSVL